MGMKEIGKESFMEDYRFLPWIDDLDSIHRFSQSIS